MAGVDLEVMGDKGVDGSSLGAARKGLPRLLQGEVAEADILAGGTLRTINIRCTSDDKYFASTSGNDEGGRVCYSGAQELS